MPQEAWVLKCYSCHKFQVQLKKMVKRWKCVVCGAKQDVIKIYFTGHPRDCRGHVQNFNMALGEAMENERANETDRIDDEEEKECYEQKVQLENLCNQKCDSDEKESSDLESTDFDIHELIFQASRKAEKRKEKKYVPKLSIFESYEDIDESLDF